ncbi:hypothetical protein H0539_001430 [Salmonella enterica]|nr:hypothetical protein [Salmonella enterica]EGB1972467.1 hypothetical protein [Salmonella enterica]
MHIRHVHLPGIQFLLYFLTTCEGQEGNIVEFTVVLASQVTGVTNNNMLFFIQWIRMVLTLDNAITVVVKDC